MGLPIGVLTFTLVCGLPVGAAYCAGWSLLYASTDDWPLTATFLLLTVVAPLAVLWSLPALTALQRRRFRATLGVAIPALPAGTGDGPWPVHRARAAGTGDGPWPVHRARAAGNGDGPWPVHHARAAGTGDGPWPVRLARTARAAATWRQAAYHVLALVIGVAGAALTLAFWSAGIGLGAVLPLQALGLLSDEAWWPVTAPTAVLAVAALLAAPWVARGVARIDTSAARALLGPSRSDELTLRVESLARSRADVVAATDAERRRIERDLHDGAQQRLVSLAMNLGMARANLTDAPGPARQAIEAAHDEATQALAELREFVRGLHPAVLDDRGLDAALSGIAARVPMPVRLSVAVPQRCSPVIEAIAYFVVSEALTNITKHAGATHAEVTVDRTADGLRVVVTDDGRGGATTAGAGTGLRGLAQRAASVDGTFALHSPVGGPTTITVELPCVS
ncbi:hypothetical protein Q0Z83_023470 [Actinoplanes sichuanensis]|nr:hypothetical protein Q0Z83_023470 [Actinoplanes sichuanensis]